MANKNARNLRSNQTDAEKKLWKHLRGKSLGGFRFRRQHPMDHYVVDFVCLEEQLIIELDGGQHADQIESDAQRTTFLETRGFKVIRFWNNDVMENVEGVCERILERLSSA